VYSYGTGVREFQLVRCDRSQLLWTCSKIELQFSWCAVLAVVLLWCVASQPVIGWRLPPSNSTQITDKCGVGHDSCCVSGVITHYDQPSISSASNQHRAKRHGDVFILICVYMFLFCEDNTDTKVPVVTIEFPCTSWRNSSATRSQCASYRSVRSQSSSTSW